MKIENLIAKDEVLAELPNEWLFERIRIWRNAQLKATDWTQVLDAPVDTNAWAQYRQKLRDLPTSVSNPAQIVFPEPPTN